MFFKTFGFKITVELNLGNFVELGIYLQPPDFFEEIVISSVKILYIKLVIGFYRSRGKPILSLFFPRMCIVVLLLKRYAAHRYRSAAHVVRGKRSERKAGSGFSRLKQNYPLTVTNTNNYHSKNCATIHSG